MRHTISTKFGNLVLEEGGPPETGGLQATMGGQLLQPSDGLQGATEGSVPRTVAEAVRLWANDPERTNEQFVAALLYLRYEEVRLWEWTTRDERTIDAAKRLLAARRRGDPQAAAEAEGAIEAYIYGATEDLVTAYKEAEQTGQTEEEAAYRKQIRSLARVAIEEQDRGMFSHLQHLLGPACAIHLGVTEEAWNAAT